MAALPETVPIKDSRSRRLNVANSLGTWLVVRFLSAPVGSSLYLFPCGRGRIASLDAIRVRGCDLSLGRNPSPQPSKSELRSSRSTRGEGARCRCLCASIQSHHDLLVRFAVLVQRFAADAVEAEFGGPRQHQRTAAAVAIDPLQG